MTSQFETGNSLDPVDVHSVLSNERRRRTIQILRSTNGGLSVRDLSERIAERESDERPAPRNVRRSVYISLVQSHLPKLDDLDVVAYDSTAKHVRLGANAERVISTMGAEEPTVPHEHYLVVSVAGLVSIFLTTTAVVSTRPGFLFGVTTAPLVVVVALSVYHRLRS